MIVLGWDAAFFCTSDDSSQQGTETRKGTRQKKKVIMQRSCKYMASVSKWCTAAASAPHRILMYLCVFSSILYSEHRTVMINKYTVLFYRCLVPACIRRMSFKCG